MSVAKFLLVEEYVMHAMDMVRAHPSDNVSVRMDGSTQLVVNSVRSLVRMWVSIVIPSLVSVNLLVANCNVSVNPDIMVHIVTKPVVP